METRLSLMAHALKAECAHFPALTKPMPTQGTYQDLLAAALGYGSFASYLASNEESDDLTQAGHVVLDLKRLCEQLFALGYTELVLHESMVAAISRAFSNCVAGLQVHQSVEDLRLSLAPDVVEVIRQAGGYDTYQTEMSVALEWHDAVPMQFANARWDIDVVWTALIEERVDGAMVASTVKVEATVRFTKLGRRVLSRARAEGRLRRSYPVDPPISTESSDPA